MNLKSSYQVLGVSEYATDTELDAAYQALVQKYHPSHYENHPLQQMARNKMDQIETAYQVIKQARSTTGHTNDAQGTEDFAQDSSRPHVYDATYKDITEPDEYGQGGYTRQSDQQRQRYANQSYDSYDRQQTNYQNQYQRPYEPMNMCGGPTRPPQGSPYYQSGYGRGSCCDGLCTLCVLDSCCECLGGDLCTCC